VQWLSSAFGGYIAGRLRTKWVGLHDDEVLFRDTAHGLLSWALATVVTVALIVSAGSSILGAGTQAAATVAGAAAQGAAQGTAQNASMADPTGYLLDTLFRPAAATTTAQPGQSSGTSGRDPRAESARILAEAVATGQMPDADKTYLAQLVAVQTGLSVEEAQKRVDDVFAEAKAAQTKALEGVDAARKAAAQLSFFTAFSLVIGAFVAAVAGAIGGRQRDYV
jgi:hypothetical protein